MFNFSDKLANVGLSAIRKITDLWKGARSDSLIDYTQVARVEPIVLIDTDCLYLDSLSEVQQSLLSIFAGYYLQAVAISTSVGKIEVMRHLDKLNPRRNAGDSAADTMGWLLAEENYKHCLPTFQKKVALESIGLEDTHDSNEKESAWGNMDANDRETIYRRDAHNKHMDSTASRANARRDEERKDRKEQSDAAKFDFDATMKYRDADFKDAAEATRVKEAQRQYEFNEKKFGHDKAQAIFKEEMERAGLQLRKDERQDKLTASEVGFGKDTMKDLKELANLSVGKMFSVEITDGLHKANIMVSIRLMASSLPSNSLVHILSIGSQDNSAKERYHSWKAGRLEFIKDLCLCQDLIDAHRKNLMADKDGIYTNLLKRARGNQLSTILSGNPSVATASNIVILSNTTAESLEVKTNLKLSDFHSREKIMKDTYVMLLVIIDKEWDRITIYSRGLHQSTSVGIKDLKVANSNKGIDASEIMKIYQAGGGLSI